MLAISNLVWMYKPPIKEAIISA